MKELTRSDYEILSFLKNNMYISKLESATLQEIMQITKNTRTTTYNKMMNLCEQKYVGKGCKAVNADTFFLLEKGKRLVEAKEPDISTHQTDNNIAVSYDISSVRTKLVDIMERGLMLKSIAVNAGLSESELSRFKNGVDSLKESDMKLLADYLNAVDIPLWNTSKEPKKQMTARERIMASRERSKKIESTRQWLFM